MSYDVYWVKNRAEKIADFEHPTRRGTDDLLWKAAWLRRDAIASYVCLVCCNSKFGSTH